MHLVGDNGKPLQVPVEEGYPVSFRAVRRAKRLELTHSRKLLLVNRKENEHGTI